MQFRPVRIEDAGEERGAKGNLDEGHGSLLCYLLTTLGLTAFWFELPELKTVRDR
jgi:hypothetical protein